MYKLTISELKNLSVGDYVTYFQEGNLSIVEKITFIDTHQIDSIATEVPPNSNYVIDEDLSISFSNIENWDDTRYYLKYSPEHSRQIKLLHTRALISNE